MAYILTQNEATPESYPATPEGLSMAAAALDADAIWARIEAYTAHRFSEREVVWVIRTYCGGEEFRPPLGPVVASTAEIWSGSAWEAITLADGPTGIALPDAGTYRLTATVGAGPVPAEVAEAFRRLAEYSAEIGADSLMSGHGSHTQHDVDFAGNVKEGFTRSQAWAAKALQLSGAADLLRRHRKV